jgi:4-amino-4-deoxy-L-arabinose transferase-like glycosyltransferase
MTEAGRARAALAGIFVAACALRFWNVGAPALTADESLHYLPEMQQIHLLSFAEQRAHPTAMHHSAPPNPMGHPLFALQVTSLAMRVTDGSAETARGVMALSGSMLVLLAFGLGRDLYSREHGLAAAATACVLPLAVRYQRTLYLDSVYSLLVAAFAWCMFRACRSRRPEWTAAAGILLGLATATKTSAPLVTLFAIAFMLFAWHRSRRPQNPEGESLGGPRSALFKLAAVLGVGGLVFSILVSPASYLESIRNPADTAYRGRDLLFYANHLWTRRWWLGGVALFLWTPPVLIAAVGGIAVIARRWRPMKHGDALVILWLISMAPLVVLHLGGLSGEHGYLSFVVPVALLVSVALDALPRNWRMFAWILILAATVPAAILYGHRLTPTPYGSYLDHAS